MNENTHLPAIRHFIEETFLYMKPGYVLGEDDSLIKTNVVDSMGVLEVLGFLEEKYGITPTDEEVTEANLGTLRSIARYISSKQAGSAKP
jgi:acyl carrier protein